MYAFENGKPQKRQVKTEKQDEDVCDVVSGSVMFTIYPESFNCFVVGCLPILVPCQCAGMHFRAPSTGHAR